MYLALTLCGIPSRRLTRLDSSSSSAASRSLRRYQRQRSMTNEVEMRFLVGRGSALFRVVVYRRSGGLASRGKPAGIDALPRSCSGQEILRHMFGG